MAKGMWFVSDNTKYAGKKSDQGAPKSGSYAPPKATRAQNTSESIPSSAWADRKGNGITSRQPAAKYPAETVHSDNARAKELLRSDDGYGNRPDTSGRFFK